MTCPRCGLADPGSTECPRCGVVFAKLGRRSRPERPPSSPPRRGFSWLDALLVAAFVAAGAAVVLRWNRPEAPTPPTSLAPVPRAALATEPAADPASISSSSADPLAWPPAGLSAPPESPAPQPSTAGRDSSLPLTEVPGVGARVPPDPQLSVEAREFALPSPDAESYLELVHDVVARVEIDSSRIERAEGLLGRHPAVADVGRLAEAVLELAAQQATRRGRRPEAVRYRERAAELQPESRGAWLRLVAGHEEEGSWREAELAARRGLSALPDESALHVALARALAQQGRDEDGADVLRRRLASRDDPAARAALAPLERELRSVAGLARRASSHFEVRFEGRDDAALGGALLQVLEEKYAMLARTLDFEPDRAIPVVLLPDETFRSATSAPGWAGAFYSHGDGRIRVRTRDMTAGFVPVDLERTLTHELTHAFVHARTRGAVPDDINEGLAQYLSGRRLGYRLDPARAVVRGSRVNVDDFYDSSLSFVEYLVDRYRQPTLNDLLRQAGETGSVDQAFRRAFRQSYDETRAEWLRQLQ